MPLVELKPSERHNVIDLLKQAGADVADWSRYRGRDPSKNPKYCYNWSFEQAGEFITLCLWHGDLKERDGRIFFSRDAGAFLSKNKAAGSAVWLNRSKQFIRNVEKAFREQLPIRAIILEGKQRKYEDENPKASSVKFRKLDDVSWAVTEYDRATGKFVILRNAKPVLPVLETSDHELSMFEGRTRERFVRHRRREAKLRRAKLDEYRKKHGRIFCEVLRCGFDFEERYGEVGKEYAQVHHRLPLEHAPKEGRATKLSDLAVVCANCHAMIHHGGQCRPLENLIPALR